MNPELITETEINFINDLDRFDDSVMADDFYLKFLFDHAGKYPEKTF